MSDERVEHRPGERLGEIVLVGPAAGELPQAGRIAGDADLLVRGELGQAVELIQRVEIAARGGEQAIEDGGEVRTGHQCGEIGGTLLKAEPVRLHARELRQADAGQDEEMAQFVRHDVEIERE